jgi:ADP-L-glycero-D-manno-heptose 6-epimerase
MIIVTGGAGFIGSNIIEALERSGYTDIVVCDVLGEDDKWHNLAKRELRDIVHPNNLFDYLVKHRGQIETIIHMGAISSTTETDADLIIETNFVLSRLIWRWCADYDVRLIYASSAATYGDGEQGFDDYEDPKNLAKLRPLNAYGWSKHVFDRRNARLIANGDKNGTPNQWVGLKFFNVYGPNEYHKGNQKSVVCGLYPQISNGAAAKLFKSYNPKYQHGGQLRDFIYVKDCVDVIMWMLENEKISGLFNVGTGQARSFEDLAKASFAAIKKEPKITYVDMPETLQPKYQYFTQANMEKLRKAGYTKEFTNLEDGVKDYIQSFLMHSDPYL